VRDWTDVTPRLLRSFLVNYTIRKPFYRYEKLFADYWVGQVRCIASAASDGLGWPLMTSDGLPHQVAVHRERCLADERARHAPNYTYDYNLPAGWHALNREGQPERIRPWASDAAASVG